MFLLPVPAAPSTVNAKANATSVLDLKSAALTLIAVVLKSRDQQALAAELERRFVDGPNPFDNDPVLIDLAALKDDTSPIDLAALVALLGRHRMRVVAVRGGSPEQHAQAQALDLSEAPEELPLPAAAPRAPEPVLEAVHESAAAPSAPAEVAAVAPAEAPAARPQPPAGAPTLVIDRPIRSGQQVYARGGDVIVRAAVNFGAELIADGNVHVYGPLRGRAIAGARGDTSARIFTTSMEPQLISIAGIYRTAENPLPADVVGQPAQVRLDGERLIIEPLIP